MFRVFKLFGWAILFYLFIFQPIVDKYIYIGIEIVLVSCLFFRKRGLFKENMRLFKREYIFAGLICGYSLLLDVAHFNLVYLDRFVASFFQGYLVSLFIIYCISSSSFLQKNLENCLVLVCFIACSITIAAILIPSVGDFCISYATLDIKDRLQDLFVESGYNHFRSFGLSESLNFTYAYVLSIIGGYLLSNSFRIYTPIMLLMILVAIIFNARIAFVPLMISLFYLLFIKKKSVHSMLSFLVTCSVFAFLISRGMTVFPELNNEWGLSFFKDLSSFLYGDGEGTVGTLTGPMWVIPDNFIDFVFGTGVSIFNANTNNSDVGYILQLNYGGVILLLIIIFYFLYISRRVLHELSIKHWYATMFICSVFLLNFKGFYLSAIPGCRFLTFLYVYYIYASRKGIKGLNPGCKLVIS